MPARNDSLKERLSRYREIKITLTGRKSGRSISIPVWFVLDGDKLYLLPVQGSATQWYKNVVNHPAIGIDARGAEAEFQAVLITDSRKNRSSSGNIRIVGRLACNGFLAASRSSLGKSAC
jgi:deazaflavin-dependent oxidoreductase (nitroreductase family)